MDNDTMALNDQVEVENDLDTTPVSEEQASGEASEPMVETEATAEVNPEVAQAETEDSSKKGYNARIRELNAAKKAAEEKAESLAQKLATLTGSNEPQVGFNQPQFDPQVEPIIKPGEEVDTLELDRRLRDREAKILQKADAMATLRSKQGETITRINNEANDALRKYPVLDPESDTYNRELSNAVTKASLAYVQANPYAASVKEFVDDMMKPYLKAVTKEVGKATENIAKQVSETAVRPSSVQTAEKSDREMSEAELEKKYGIVY